MHVRPLFQNLGLLLGSLIVVIALGEIGLRVTGIGKGHVVPPPIYRQSSNPEISYALKPNLHEKAFRSTITTNSLGFRSPEIDSKKPIIAVLGDSITFGYGVENDQALPQLLQKELPAFNIVNTGVPGYNLTQERATYAEKLAKLNPKALIVIFYWNDIRDLDPAVLASDGNLYAKGQVPPPHTCAPITEGVMGMIPGKCWLDTHSAIYRVLKKLVIQKQIKQDQKEQEQTLGNDLTYEYLSDQNLQKYAAELQTLRDITPPDMPRLFVIWPERPLHFAMRPKLKKIAEDRGFKVLDLYEIFGNNSETLGWDTVHPSANTLQKAADVVKAALEYYKML